MTNRRAPASLPNVLTYLRILAVPAVVAVPVSDPRRHRPLVGAGASTSAPASPTGWTAIWRASGASSRLLGRVLDPIADKLLVGATLLMLTHDNTIDGVHVAAAVIILCREILVSGLREFLAELNVRVHVTQLAKWKTTMQMIALGVLLAGPAGDKIVPGVTSTGLVLLWMAALLTLWTGYDYLQGAVRTAIDALDRASVRHGTDA